MNIIVESGFARTLREVADGIETVNRSEAGDLLERAAELIGGYCAEIEDLRNRCERLEERNKILDEIVRKDAEKFGKLNRLEEGGRATKLLHELKRLIDEYGDVKTV